MSGKTPGPEPTASSARARNGLARRAILVVDDDDTVREYVSEALRRRGHHVVEAAGGRDALRVVYSLSTSPALLVSDIDMPGMSGVELAARLSADRPGTRVVLMTGDPESAELARARPELVAGVLLKPFALDALLSAVDAALATPPD